MIKAAIFDLDGLLIDSETIIWPKSIRQFLEDRGIVYSDSITDKARGSGHRETIKIFKEDLGLEGEEDKLIEEMRSYFYKNFLQNPKLINGALELIGKLARKKYVLAIATGLGPKNNVMKILNALKIDKYFKGVITGDEVGRGKPDPEIYSLSVKKLGLKSSECLVLEDAVNGVLAGKAAGMRVFGVNKDEKMRLELMKAGADKVFSSLLEIEI